MIKARKTMGVLLLIASVISGQAQTSTNQPPAQTAKARHKTPAQLEQDLDNLSAKYEQLEREMAEFKAQADRRETELKAASKQARTAELAAEAASQQERLRAESTLEIVTRNDAAVSDLKSAVSDLRMSSVSLVETIQTEQQKVAAPKAIPFMGISIKPGGFLAGESVLRQRGIGGDVNTRSAL